MSYKKIVFLLFFLSSGLLFQVKAAEIKYPVSAIPDSLKKFANAVVRNQEVFFDLTDIDKATVKITSAITILNKSALQKSYFIQFYDQFRKVNHIKGAVYDANGELVKKIKLDDILDYSANLGGAVFQDYRVKLIDPEYLKFPFTVEYYCEIDFKGLLNYPSWQIFTDYNIAVEKSQYSLKRPGHLEVRKHYINLDIEPTEKIIDGDQVLTWEVRNMKALKKEKFGVELADTAPTILFAPSDFLIDGYKGNCETWEGFGKWIYSLNEKRRILPAETVNKIKNLVRNADSDYEKSKILYQYLQDNTRYVSVQIGIGGWRPMEAETVDRLSYGDCKALTNYMQSMLDVVGIESYYTLVRAGENSSGIVSDFPSNQFNHAILCSIIEGDTVWMECTSQRVPFGYIGSFTDDRDVLLITTEGGKLRRTKAYSSDENRKTCNATIMIDSDGNAAAQVSTDFNGVYYDEKLPVLISDDEDQKKLIREELHIPNFVLEDYSLTEKRDIIPAINENLQLTFHGCGTKFGNRMAINLNMINKTGTIPSKKAERRTDIVVKRSLIEIDTVIYQLPDSYVVEKVSANLNLKCKFGELRTEVSYDDTQIQFIRFLQLNKGTYPTETYGEFYEFYKKVKKGDSDKAILIQKVL